jgi:hypothetical protein
MEGKTNIEHFNSYLKLFVENIAASFPELKAVLQDYYKPLLETDTCNDDKYVKRYMKKMSEHKNTISTKNDALFNDSIYILKNVDFKEVWVSDELSDTNKNVIWDYIQTLYILGETIMGDVDKVLSLVNNFKQIKDGNFDEEASGMDNELLGMFRNLSENKNNTIDENFLNDCSLGKLASELTSEIDLSDMNLGIDENSNPADMFTNLMSGDNSMNFMNLIQKVGQKIHTKVESGEFNQDKLMEEAQKMMAGLQGAGGAGGAGGMGDLFASMAGAMGGGAGAGAGAGDTGDLFASMAGAMGGGGGGSAESSNPTKDRLRKKLEKRNNGDTKK